MNVLKHGKCKFTKVVCPACQCKFKYTVRDTHIEHGYDLFNDVRTLTKVVDCPECYYQLKIKKVYLYEFEDIDAYREGVKKLEELKDIKAEE